MKENNSVFEGTWKGIAAIAYRAWVYLKIEQTASGYKAVGHVAGATGVKEYALLKGEVKDGKLCLSVVDYSQSDPVGNDVFEARLVLEPLDDKLKLQFRNDLGAIADSVLVRDHSKHRVVLSRMYRYSLSLRQWIARRAPAFFTLFLIAVFTYSFLGYSNHPIGPWEAILLLLPYALICRHVIRDFFDSLQIVKVWGIERQPRSGVETNAVSTTISVLQEKYGQQFFFFVWLRGFLVPNSKSLLSVLASKEDGVKLAEAKRIADHVGITSDNFLPTVRALIEGHCITANDKEGIVVTETGKRFLQFEAEVKSSGLPG